MASSRGRCWVVVRAVLVADELRRRAFSLTRLTQLCTGKGVPPNDAGSSRSISEYDVPKIIFVRMAQNCAAPDHQALELHANTFPEAAIGGIEL